MIPDSPENAAILNLLKKNPRGMSLRQISEAIGMNRITAARYLDVLKTAGMVDMKPYGQAKVYFLSKRVPVSAMLDFTSDLVLIVGCDDRILNANKPLLDFLDRSLDEVTGLYPDELFTTKKGERDIISGISEAFSGNIIAEEIFIKKKNKVRCFFMKIIPVVFYDGQPGLAVILKDNTERKKFEDIVDLQKDLGWKLSSAITYHDALPLSLKTVMAILNMESGGIYLVNDTTGDLDLFLPDGSETRFLNIYRKIEKDSAFYNIISERNYYLNSNDFDIFPPNEVNNLEKRKILSIAIISVKSRDQFFAAIILVSKKKTEFEKWLIAEAESAAAITANVIIRIKALEKLKNSENRYKMLFNHTNDTVIPGSSEGDKNTQDRQDI
ncbi:PAS domain-containing protein [Methanomicrobium sp. W14]|uniref:helix-turn-helix domain-containing protein n=1 Tax=Methanomicrobium sp. W14 TaxID=2817839 RepID=UPI001AE3BD6E|nr:helix-turn-helix domain-containing protein [Methanomicrobium sp. W14]MBP2134311.1 PAS domain-containing protein [Methanomicrobium sp. W14]